MAAKSNFRMPKLAVGDLVLWKRQPGQDGQLAHVTKVADNMINLRTLNGRTQTGCPHEKDPILKEFPMRLEHTGCFEVTEITRLIHDGADAIDDLRKELERVASKSLFKPSMANVKKQTVTANT